MLIGLGIQIYLAQTSSWGQTMQWEYKHIVTQYTGKSGDLPEHKVRWVNGQEVPNWKQGPSLTEHFNKLGLDGWELISIDIPNVWFRRSIS